MIGALIVASCAVLGGVLLSRSHPGSAGGSAAQAGPGAPGQRGPRNLQPEMVTTVPVRQVKFAREVEALGTAGANESVDITAKVSNRIAAIHFTEGQQVNTGTVLLELDAQEVRADLQAAQAALTESRSQYNRSRELLQTKALSQSQMDQIEATMQANQARVAAAQSRLDDTVIRAPFAGRVGLRHVSLGGFVSPGVVVTTLDDTSIIKLDFSVPETFLAAVKEGMEVKAVSVAYPTDIFSGQVASIDTRVDPVSRSVMVRALIKNADRRLKPGMFLTLKLTHDNEATLVLPEQTLVPEDNRQFVFAVRDGKAHKIPIEVGRRRPGEVEVLHGLRAGDIVVLEGTQKLRDGAPVRVMDASARTTGAAP